MDHLIHEVLNKEEARLLRNKLLGNKGDWEDGKKTAGSQAAKVKKNLQLNKESSKYFECNEYVTNQIKSDDLINCYCLPKKIHGVIFSKSECSQGYGMHVDNAYMKSGRSDISFTLFLSDKNSYEGGELCIQTTQEEEEIKLSEGKAVFYPSTSLHSVKEVTKGQRLVCVGWIQSYIASNEDRNILFGLNAGARGLFAEYGGSPQLDLVFQAYNNLLRKLGD